MIIIHASTGPEPIIRLERDEQSVEAAHMTAAPLPPRIASIGESCLLGQAGPGSR
jgi:hypothetical protein